MIKTAAIALSAILVASGLYVILRPQLHQSDGKTMIVMFGQSTMGLWFKHWNWPYLLRIRTTYKPWPIPFTRYSIGNLYLEYFPVANPNSKDPSEPFGEKMLRDVKIGLSQKNYDAAFFKFCFVDFPVKNGDGKRRFGELKSVIEEVYAMTSHRNMKLIVGNALPLPNPNEETLSLQRNYNKWLKEFAGKHDDAFAFDLFSPLTLENGKFNMELARSKNDHHPGEKAFSLLDRKLFSQMSKWLRADKND